ncbi:MAG TPA: hypothetical protein VEQ10_14165, partial [Vicinamibacteria bacterium]|nr:hypothetical protein [Vicinamibacteria bacterium]
DPRARITHYTFNDVLPLLMGRYLGPGLLGLGVTAMIAGFMSGMAGNVSAFATVWTYDVYKPLFRRNASDRHYLAMGRWCSILGVLISIAAAYALLWFSNILEFLQVLVFFFIVPLFGTVILGMLWKRATSAGGFWGFVAAIVASIGMWTYVHTFPEGYSPQPKVTLGEGSVVSLQKDQASGALRRVTVESGQVAALNVALAGFGAPAQAQATAVTTALALPASVTARQGTSPVQVLAPQVTVAGQPTRFGVEGVEVVLRPGVRLSVSEISQRFAPAAFNPDHTQYVARSRKAKPMAVNMYSGWWSLVVCVVVTVLVSLFTRPKPEAELKNLVYGLTPRPDEGKPPWYESPALWATLVTLVLVAVNLVFW